MTTKTDDGFRIRDLSNVDQDNDPLFKGWTWTSCGGMTREEWMRKHPPARHPGIRSLDNNEKPDRDDGVILRHACHKCGAMSAYARGGTCQECWDANPMRYGPFPGAPK